MTNEAAPPLALTQARGSPRLRQEVADASAGVRGRGADREGARSSRLSISSRKAWANDWRRSTEGMPDESEPPADAQGEDAVMRWPGRDVFGGSCG